MIEEGQFLRSIIPDTTILHGVQCRPYALGHSLILKRLDSPFVDVDFFPESVSYGEFLEALFVIAHTWEENLRLQGTAEVLRLQKQWHRRWSLFGFRRVPVKLKTEMLRRHIMNGLDWPELQPNLSEQTGESIELDSPRAQVLIVHCLQKLHLPLTDILNMPFGFIFWLYATATEMTGHYNLGHESIHEAYRREADDLQARIDSGEFKV